MAVTEDDLPDYENPPVVEVAASIQFAPLRNFTAAHVGPYWDTIRDRLDRFNQQPPIAHVIELEELGPEPPAFQVQFAAEPQLPRVWFASTDGSELIQVQSDRFVYNWKKCNEGAEYPRYGQVKDLFWGYWKGFQSFLEKQGLALPSVDQCELTYVNMLPQGKGWTFMRDLETIFTAISWEPRTRFLPEPERLAWQMSFKLPGGEGRLRADATPVFVPPDNTLAMHLVLTVRGRPKDELNDDKIIGWFDLARKWIVKGFVDLVTDKTDALWGRK